MIVRKAYGAGLYAMAGPGVRPRRVHRAAHRDDRGDGAEAAVNAVYYNKLQAIEDPDERAQRTEQLRAEYAADIDILHLASELVVDAVVAARRPARRADPPLRDRRGQAPRLARKRNPVTPV